MSEENRCKACFGSVHRDASYCPHCRSPQNKASLFKQYLPMLIVAVIIVSVVKVVSTHPRKSHVSSPTFVDYKNSIVVKSSELSFTECGDCKKKINAVVIGLIDNDTDFGWRDFDLEVRYFNSDGEMIDTVSDSIYGLSVQPHSEVSFRVMERAAKLQDVYADHKVYISDARRMSKYY